MANNTVHTITLSGYTAATGGNCWALQLGTWDSYGIEQIQLALGPEWEGLVITATFTPPKGSAAIKVVVDSSGLFDVPQEATALSGRGTITFAGNASGQQRISVDVPYVVANHAAVDGVTPDPTPSEWAQFVAQVQQARDDAEAAAQAAEGSQTAAAGSASAAAESAQEAQNIVDGAVQDITDAKNAAVQAVNDTGDAKIKEIEAVNALVPTPTPEGAGKAVVVKPDGTGYELGDAGSEIDDTVVAPDTTWSSLNIVNKLCPPFSVTGDVVQFNPVEGYPLSVQSTIVATQEGTGDPSPINVRPIVPVNEVGVWVGGKNLCPDFVYTTNSHNSILLKDSFGFVYDVFQALLKPGVQYRVNATVKLSNGTVSTFTEIGVAYENGEFFTIRPTSQAGSVGTSKIKYIYFYGGPDTNDERTYTNFIIAESSDAIAYEPYRGKLYTAQLDEPCYGGEIDLTEGALSVEAGVIVLPFSAMDNSENYPGWSNQNWIPDYVENPNQDAMFFSVGAYVADNIGWGKNLRFNSYGVVYFEKTATDNMTQSEIQQQYPDLSLQIVLKRVTPVKTKIAPLTILAPASPATAYSTAGEITVEGRSDPTALIQQMQEQIAALQRATIGG